jgi:hypothetical protein
MHSISSSVSITFPSGGTFKGSAEWTGLDDSQLAFVTSHLDDMAKSAQKHGGTQPGGIVVVFSADVDGAPLSDVSVGGVSYHDLVKFERQVAMRIAGEFIDVAEQHAKTKKP